MALPDPKIPGYCPHRPTNRGYARFGGRTAKPSYFPGPFGSDQSIQAFLAARAEFAATGRVRPRGGEPSAGVTVDELILTWWRHADAHSLYVKAGKPTSERAIQRAAFRRLGDLYGAAPTGEFGLTQLDVIRAAALADAPKSAARYAGRIRSLFRWGEDRGLVPPGTAAKLAERRGLGNGRRRPKRNRGAARKPANPFSAGCVALVAPPELRAMIWFQWLTGARPGGAVALRPADVDRSGPLWLYREPEDIAAKVGAEEHWVGPRAQAALGPFLDACRSPDEFAFRPSRRPGLARHGRWTTAAYRRAVTRLCDRLGVERFTPGQLRHSHLTTVRRLFGLDAARARGGHTTVTTTQLYAEMDADAARRVAREIG